MVASIGLLEKVSIRGPVRAFWVAGNSNRCLDGRPVLLAGSRAQGTDSMSATTWYSLRMALPRNYNGSAPTLAYSSTSNLHVYRRKISRLDPLSGIAAWQ